MTPEFTLNLVWFVKVKTKGALQHGRGQASPSSRIRLDLFQEAADPIQGLATFGLQGLTMAVEEEVLLWAQVQLTNPLLLP